jgi:hypothetical protein
LARDKTFRFELRTFSTVAAGSMMTKNILGRGNQESLTPSTPVDNSTILALENQPT